MLIRVLLISLQRCDQPIVLSGSWEHLFSIWSEPVPPISSLSHCFNSHAIKQPG